MHRITNRDEMLLIIIINEDLRNDGMAMNELSVIDKGFRRYLDHD